jgi:hypothetical protein
MSNPKTVIYKKTASTSIASPKRKTEENLVQERWKTGKMDYSDVGNDIDTISEGKNHTLRKIYMNLLSMDNLNFCKSHSIVQIIIASLSCLQINTSLISMKESFVVY